MLLDLIFPKRCVGCGKKGDYICISCLSGIKNPRRRVGVIILFSYSGVVRKAIIRIKYKFTFDITRSLGDIALAKIRKNSIRFPKNSLIVPIPTHKRRENWRGFNQSQIFAKQLAKGLGLGFVPNLLIKCKNTTPQAQLLRELRLTNLSNSFIFNSKYNKYKDRTIILFDDVYTTGATLSEAKKTLLSSGFKKIILFALCG